MESIHEEWRQLKAEFSKYEVSNRGSVRKAGGRIISQCYEKEGYLVCSLQSSVTKKFRQFRVHRLVAMAFVKGYLDELSVNHLNGMKGDNRAENLEWCTEKRNRQHAIETGLVKIRKLTNEQAGQVRELRKAGKSCATIGRIFGVNEESIRLIGKGEIYKYKAAI